MLRRGLAMAVVGLALAGCGDGTLHRLETTGGGPDEFAIVPADPLEMPPTFAELPRPLLGAPNRADPTPRQDAVIALGGRPQPPLAIGAGDRALIAYAARGGVTPGIRAILAEEDAAFRQRRSSFLGPRLFARGDPYFRAYRGQALDAYAELQRFRAAGVVTPTAPPR